MLMYLFFICSMCQMYKMYFLTLYILLVFNVENKINEMKYHDRKDFRKIKSKAIAIPYCIYRDHFRITQYVCTYHWLIIILIIIKFLLQTLPVKDLDFKKLVLLISFVVAHVLRLCKCVMRFLPILRFPAILPVNILFL